MYGQPALTFLLEAEFQQFGRQGKELDSIKCIMNACKIYQ